MPGYRYYKDAAHSIVHSLASGLWHDGKAYLAEHLASAALRDSTSEVRLNFMDKRVEPLTAATPSLNNYVEQFSRRWAEYVERVGGDPARVRAVYIAAICDLSRPHPAPELGGQQATILELTGTIVDDRGQSHVSAPPLGELYATVGKHPDAAT